jgi:hypothetical protein
MAAYSGLKCTAKWPSIPCAGLCVYLVAIEISTLSQQNSRYHDIQLAYKSVLKRLMSISNYTHEML